MTYKTLKSLCCAVALLSGCERGHKVQDTDLNTEATLIQNDVSSLSAGVFVQMDFDTNNDKGTVEFRGVDFCDQREGTSTVDAYRERMKQYKAGDKKKLKEWKQIVPNIFDMEKYR